MSVLRAFEACVIEQSSVRTQRCPDEQKLPYRRKAKGGSRSMAAKLHLVNQPVGGKPPFLQESQQHKSHLTASVHVAPSQSYKEDKAAKAANHEEAKCCRSRGQRPGLGPRLPHLPGPKRAHHLPPALHGILPRSRGLLRHGLSGGPSTLRRGCIARVACVACVQGEFALPLGSCRTPTLGGHVACASCCLQWQQKKPACGSAGCTSAQGAT